MNPHYQKWQDYAASRPAATSNAFHTTGLWFLYNMLNTLLSNALVTSGVAIAASFIILMFVTMNVVTSILATICICIVILGVIGVVMLMGARLGMYECLVMILSIGLAVDYDVHITHFYNIAQGSRKEKTIEAISGVGISILGGAATTMGAGLPLFFCAMTFFKLCGWFIFFTSLISLVSSFGAQHSHRPFTSTHTVPQHTQTLHLHPHLAAAHTQTLHLLTPHLTSPLLISPPRLPSLSCTGLLVPMMMIAGPEGSTGDLSVLFGCKKAAGKRTAPAAAGVKFDAA